jgi:predicted flap endonuclease-1-like 5' DNA nuclease
MFWLFSEIWFWCLLASLLGSLLGWWLRGARATRDRVEWETSLAAQRRSADDAAAARTKIQGELDAVKSSHTSLTSELSTARASLTAATAVAGTATAAATSAKSNDASDAAEIARLRTELTAANSALTAQRAATAAAKSDDVADDAEIARLRAELASCKASSANLTSDLSTARAALTAATAAAGTATAAASSARANDASDAAEISRLKGLLDALRAQQAEKDAELTKFRAASATQNEKLPLFLDRPRGVPDDLKLIKGVGEKLNTLLTSMGIFHFRQVANWTEAEIAEVDAKMENFKGRIVRDEWLPQARLLAAGKHEEFERIYGKMGENN